LRRLLTERYRERLAGVLSCYDRIIVTGTLPGACYADGKYLVFALRGTTVESDILPFDVAKSTQPLRERLEGRQFQ
jgi:hypothetical protein